MIWFTLAILSAICQSFKDISIKNNLKDISSNTLIFMLSWLSIIFWFPFVINIWIPELSMKFWTVFFISGTLFYIWKMFNFKAMEIEDISYIAPLKWLMTVWVLILSIFLLDEIPSLLGIIWIILILIWTYFLNITKYNTGILEPILRIFKNKGSRFFLVTIFCYSITVVLDKIWIIESYPIFWIFMMNIFLFTLSLKNFIPNYKKEQKLIKKNIKFILLTSVLYWLSHITQMEAINIIFAWYVSAIKISSMLFTIILWWIFFNEKDIKKKLTIGLLIVLGVILIIIW